MGTFLATWEDEENNRNVQFSVNYRAENDQVEILNVTPVKISFTCPETNTCVRTLGVHTEAGRRHLSQRFLQAGKVDELKQQIAARVAPMTAV
jgi:hypothetical protein